jgi:hypothetical protein
MDATPPLKQACFNVHACYFRFISLFRSHVTCFSALLPNVCRFESHSLRVLFNRYQAPSHFRFEPHFQVLTSPVYLYIVYFHSAHNFQPANSYNCTQLTPKTASVVPPEDGRLTPETCRAAFLKLWSADHRWSSGSALVVLLD